MASTHVSVHVARRVAHIRIDRPDRRNALSRDVLRELTDAVAQAGAAKDADVIVIEATGPVFSAGHDIAEMHGRDEGWYRELFSACTLLMNLLRQVPQPVIAKVDGVATAAGCQLVAGSDLAVASDRSTFATPGAHIGLFCSTPLVPVSRSIGQKRSLEMLLTGEPISAETALDWGLVNRVVAVDALDDAVEELATQILRFSPTILELGKLAFYEQQGLSERSAYEVMTEIMTANALLPDAQEGMAAFLDKRPPTWGR